MQSFYEATVARSAGRSSAYAPLTGRRSANVCIIGGGLAGLSTALGLAERGVIDVVVLEAEQVGFGASGRNGGFVFGGYSLDCADLLKTLGPARARELYTLTTDAVDLMRKRIQRYRIDCDVTDAGVILANWFDEPARLDTQRRLMRDSFGVEWEPVAAAALASQLKTSRYHGGLFERNAFHFHPLKYVLGVADAAANAGVQIHEKSPVVRLRPEGSDFAVHTPHGTLDARHVVMAGGGYARNVYARVERAVLPIATYVMATEPLGARLKDAMDTRAAVYDTRFAFDYYRPLPDTRILWGGRISVRDRAPEVIARLLRRDLLKVYPQLHDVRIEHAWGGLMSYARHKMPQIGRSTDGIWYAVGFGGHGMAPTTVSGELLAAAISGERPVPDAFAAFGLTRTYGALGLAAAQLTYTTMQTRDALAARRPSIRQTP
ncbi:Gamma-glutamylputrescine oxidoreductase [Paraburkholderia domus]|uniref:Gamma-glutamylputrescine oxidoreductase n=1 Tax=Paraburkholderia domus TaxID=2793075 RepID=A0A9N8N2D6_9BURK|nr:FAD-binding oxidoreductase [Paraburkholderia domus]MBK5050251.1 FAD-binding oxidoreductase [Burkholderia sp. R-70006]MBK5062462.1 FAD-binding oxidoreductase [Burkholderia sp. R-70199]MBK5089337.1 FAD-binding oxidoreductase [Burkholderia sp. R-69927]MBK5118871.1 FAD-binding oxidoreductase [Burkholderia sp. R-69980]MBK5168024.1 FAD-binding oxidoreductase [Burkholderia sp. R-70211]MBK5183410.1 FAD-binding oxidoreductase [Burkholderia sp. R-69749]MCI0144891.1 FAD-dependent oxidoreductase [Par